MKKFLNFALLYLVMFIVIIGLFVVFCITAEWKWLLGSCGFAVIIMSELFLRLYCSLKQIEYMDEEIGKALDRLIKKEDKLKELQHYYDTTVGCYCLDRDPKELLRQFWQSSSDACPLEATEAEKQEQAFEDWIVDLYWKLK